MMGGVAVCKLRIKLRYGVDWTIWIFCPPFLVLLVLSAALVESVPLNIEGPSREVANNSLTSDFESYTTFKGCRYKAQFYSDLEEVSTDEPCLACRCKGTVVVCKLRICPEIPVPPPPGCIVVHKAKSCCSQLICHGHDSHKKISREQRFPPNVSNETLLASVNDTKDSGFCILDGTVYAEGSAMRSSTLCQYCFCIRSEMKCSSPQCVIPLKGCKPRFRSYACCPTNYDCGQSNETAILKTSPSSTQVPQFLKGCLVNGQFVPEGEPVLPLQIAGPGIENMTSPTNVCQTCFCMGGVVHCRPLECDQPIDGCTPIKEDGHCCPDRYDCTKAQATLTTTSAPIISSSSTLATVSPEVTTTRTTTTVVAVETTRSTEAPAPVTTVMITGGEEVDVTTSHNDDSFERVATIVSSSSSEENSSAPPSLPQKRTRVSATVGGFKNRSDLGSREERRSKDADELTPKVSIEDDERDDSVPVFDTTPTFDDFAVTTFEDIIGSTTTDPDFESDISFETTVSNTFRLDDTTENDIIGDETPLETTLPTLQNYEQNTAEIGELVKDLSGSLSTTLPTTAHSFSSSPSSTEKSLTDVVSQAPLSSSTATSSSDTVTTTTQLASSSSTSEGSLEFIPFVVEDAFEPGSNTSLHLSDTQLANSSLFKPLQLKFNGSETSLVEEESSQELKTVEPLLPLLEDNEEQSHSHNQTISMPISTSLYNNGYYPHGSSLIKDDHGPSELLVEEGKLDEKSSSEAPVPHLSTENVNYATKSTTKRPSQPLKAISSIDKFIPSYSPATVQQQQPSSGHLPPANPSRTYSKFGMQDSPYYRIDPHHAAAPAVAADPGFGHPVTQQSSLYHHRYYNEPEVIPSSRINAPNTYYTPTGTGNQQKHSLGQTVGMLPPLYKNSQFFYEDSSAALDSYEDYDPYSQTTTSGLLPTPSAISTPKSTLEQFLGERVRLPSYNQQRATSTPKYKYAYVNNKPSVQSRLTTERTMTTAVSSSSHHHRKASHAPFPYNLPKTQDNLYNLGIKLSGCNVVGKMHSVGDIIEELSSDCVRCMCSNVGVHCGELAC